MRSFVLEFGMEKVIKKRSLADFRKSRATTRKKTENATHGTYAERIAAMSLICRTRTEDGTVERRFCRIRKTA